MNAKDIKGKIIPTKAEAKEAGTGVLAIGGGLVGAKLLNDQVLKTSSNPWVQVAWIIAGFLGAAKLKGFLQWFSAAIGAYGLIRTMNILTAGTTVAGLGFVQIPESIAAPLRKALPSLSGPEATDMSDVQFAALMAGLGNLDNGPAVQLPGNASSPQFAGMANTGIPALQLAGYGSASVGVC